MMTKTIKLPVLATKETRIDKSDCSFVHLCGFFFMKVNALNVPKPIEWVYLKSWAVLCCFVSSYRDKDKGRIKTFLYVYFSLNLCTENERYYQKTYRVLSKKCLIQETCFLLFLGFFFCTFKCKFCFNFDTVDLHYWVNVISIVLFMNNFFAC